jgi:putative Mn2+ efflux pump MntP
MKKATLKSQAIVGAWFGGFQGLMPLIGWNCIHTIVQYFKAFEALIP